MIACGTLTLFLAGGLSVALAIAFAVALIIAWKIEKTRWQLSERVSLVIVIASLPFFYVDWKYQLGATESRGDWVGVGALSHLILFLSIIKLVQVKADRDWLFLYLISFFQVLLAAGLSISPVFLVALCCYAFFGLSTIIGFEVRKAQRAFKPDAEVGTLVVPEQRWFENLIKRRAAKSRGEAKPLSLAALSSLALIIVFSIPTFLIAPRFTGSALARSAGGLDNSIGFSDKVTLGSFGRLQMNDRIVMRVRVEQPSAVGPQLLRWRGVALDEFNGTGWRNTSAAASYVTADRGLFKIDSTESLDRLTTQTFFLEAIDTPALFAAPQVVAIQGALPFVRQNREGALSTREHPLERISYKAYSDTIGPDVASLESDRGNYTLEEKKRYTEVPENVDQRIKALTDDVIAAGGAQNRLAQAQAVESYLRRNFQYSLDRRAGGPDPVGDFLFNVGAGHCEYFASAMALMLRTQGTATRVVNGFQMGEYNDAADVYTVRQLHAHSWVEVYFPGVREWVAFDPTPDSGRPANANQSSIARSFKKYAEALELLWIQYVVAYDRQEQRSLASSLRGKIGNYQQATLDNVDSLRARLAKWWQNGRRALDSIRQNNLRGAGVLAVVIVALIAGGLIFLLARKVRRRRERQLNSFGGRSAPVVEFYERLIKALEARGFRRRPDQTPLEFASTVGSPEALAITNSYNGVRFGAHSLSPHEQSEIERFLRDLEINQPDGARVSQ